MPVDKFGRMSDTKTTDSGVSLTYINNNYVRSDGGTPLTGSLDMKGNIIYNVAEPVNPQDVATKVYVDNTKGSGVIGRRIGDSVSIKENMDFMGKQKIKNLPDPVNDHDAATKEYVDTRTELGNIDMGGKFTILNVKTPINDNHITDKKYVDDNAAFVFRNNEYYAKGNIFLRDGEATTKKYVDDSLANHFIDENDNIAFGRDVDMEGNKIFALPEPDQDSDPATKKYVDDLQNRYIDKRGNIKFGRNINLDNKRIFALKDPKKDYEATNKKYVDDSITKRLQEEKDKFLPKDPATKEYVDEAIKGLAGGNILVSKEGVFIKANGHYRATAPLDIDNHKMENLPEPLEDGDAVNKKYIDGIVKDSTLKQGLIRENGGFNLVDSYINMNFNNIRNVGYPQNNADAVPKNFVDKMIGSLKETTEKTMVDSFTRLGKMLTDGLKKRKHIITASASYHSDLIKNDYQFTWGGQSKTSYKKHDVFSGFLVPSSGYIKNVAFTQTGLKFNVEKIKSTLDFIADDMGLNKDHPLFSLVLIRGNGALIHIGILYFQFKYEKIEGKIKVVENFEFNPNFEEEDLRTVNANDIINIRSEFDTFKNNNFRLTIENQNYKLEDLENEFYTYLATVLIELDPLDN